MSAFGDLMLKTINEYKATLRKDLPARQCMAKLRALGIKRKLLKGHSEAGLYSIGQKIAADVAQSISADREQSPNYHFGAEEFLRHLNKILTEYRIENGVVVSAGQKASRALVAAIQLITLPGERLNSDVALKLSEHTRIVAHSGNREQIEILSRAIKQHEPRHENFFSKLMENFEAHIDELSTAS